MKSFRPGVANCSSHTEGCTPVSQWSNAINFASCHPGDTKCTSRPNSSKQNKKKRCGYQNRQKCQNLCATAGQTFLSVIFSPRASIQHNARITAATKICVAINRAGCARFSTNKSINALETPRYPNATNSNTPQAAQA